jgi:hypothetical protein
LLSLPNDQRNLFLHVTVILLSLPNDPRNLFPHVTGILLCLSNDPRNLFPVLLLYCWVCLMIHGTSSPM